SRDYYNLPPQNNPGEYEGLVRDHLDQALNVPHYRNIMDMEYFELTVLERKGLLQDRLFNLMLGEQNLSCITNIWREAYDFLEGNSYAPRTEQKVESWSEKHERARIRKGQRLQPNGNEQGRNDKMRCPGHPHLERRVKVFGPVALPVPPSSGSACVGSTPAEIGLKALTLLMSRQLMAVGHDYYKKAPMKMNISHGGVVGGVNSDSIQPRFSETPSADYTEIHESAASRAVSTVGTGFLKSQPRPGLVLNEGDGPNVVLANPTSWVSGGEKQTWGLGSGRNITKGFHLGLDKMGRHRWSGVLVDWSDDDYFNY
ncbi:hypothetical protein Tco_1147712, partial [Tanacetum coccineum]